MTPSHPPKTRATVQPSSGLTLEQYADAKKLPVDKLRQWGLSTKDGKVPKVLMPYRLPDGQESGMRYRMSLVDEPRFLWQKGSKPTLYGLERIDRAKTQGSIIVAEGESDVHTLWVNGYQAVGVPGASIFKSTWMTYFDDITTISVIIEPDAGGNQMLGWIEKQSESFQDRVRLVRFTDYKDPSALHIADPDRFQSRFDDALENAEPWATHQDRQRWVQSEKAGEDCAQLAAEPDILMALDRSLERSGLVGERDAAFLLYLAFTSRVLKQPVSLCVKGLSSIGKSFILKKVTEHFPESTYEASTGLSEHNLQYGEEDLRHKMLIIYEWRGIHKDGEYVIDSLLSEGHLSYRTVEKGPDGRLQGTVRERPGPTGLLTTTTRTKIHEDMENRLFAITVDDTDEQTSRIFKERAKKRPKRPEADWAPWHALQDWIGTSPTTVTVPYADILADLASPKSVRLRRDFSRMLDLVETHAILHQLTRARDSNGAIVATVEDYARVRQLIHDLMAEGASISVSDETRSTVQAVRALLDESDAPGAGVTNLAVANFLNIDKTSASRRVKRALDAGYLTNEEPNFRKAKKLVIGEPLPVDADQLPTPERVQREMEQADGEHSTELPPNAIGCTVARKTEGEGGIDGRFRR